MNDNASAPRPTGRSGFTGRRLVRWTLPVVLVGSSLVAAACGGSSVATPSDPVLAKGQGIYNQRCAQCHGDKGQGGTGMKLGGGRAKQEFPDIQKQLDVIAEGRPGTNMPGWKTVLTDEEMRAVAQYERESLPG